MREIKFRVWDEKNKQFADYEDIEECLSCQGRDGWESSDGMGCCFGINAAEVLADCIIEQYTGLKDKNGKEIYEGDIIRYKVLRDDCSTRHGYKYREVIEAVKYDNEHGMYITEPYSHLGTIANHYEPEVIGNIHENKRGEE